MVKVRRDSLEEPPRRNCVIDVATRRIVFKSNEYELSASNSFWHMMT